MAYAYTIWRALSAPPASEQTLTSLAEVRALAQEEEARFRAFFDGLSEADIAGTVDLTDPRGNVSPFVLWHTLNHLMLHSMQHRTEAAAILTDRGHSPGDLDFIFFVRGRRPG